MKQWPLAGRINRVNWVPIKQAIAKSYKKTVRIWIHSEYAIIPEIRIFKEDYSI